MLIAIENNHQHNMATPKKAKYIPNIPKVTSKFLRHYELTIDNGGLPFTGKKSSHYYGWMRFKEVNLIKPPIIIFDFIMGGLINSLWPN